jgi:hypothetical protein
VVARRLAAIVAGLSLGFLIVVAWRMVRLDSDRPIDGRSPERRR